MASALTATGSLDLIGTRRHFPALQRQHLGQPVAYFDGPGGTQVPTRVVAAVSEYLYHHNANTHWSYPTSIETDAILAEARAAFGDFLGAAVDEIAFGANMTTLTFHLARALGRRWGPGDEIVVTELDHHANVAPWQAVARDRGVTLRMVPMDTTTGTLRWPELEAALGPKTRLLAIGAASNALGTITDVTRAAALAHAAGALCFVDAVHLAAHERVNVRAIGCDFLACSSYKFYGPHVGILFGRHDRVAELDVPRLEPASNTPPERLETGTLNHEGIAGAHAAVEFLASLGQGESRRERLDDAARRLHDHGQSLLEQLWAGLQQIPGVTLYGPPPGQPRTPTVSFTVSGVPSAAVATRLAEQAVFVSNGDFYATTVVERLGLTESGLVRAGCACYTTPDEVARLIAAVSNVAERGRT